MKNRADTTPDRAEAAAADLRDFSQSLPMALLRAREAVMARFRPNLRLHNVTEQQWRVLRALAAAADEVETTRLADMVMLLPPSLSRILKDLIARDLIARRTPETDLRRSLVSLSPTGEALIAKASPSSEAIYAEIESLYGTEALADLRALLTRLETVLGA
ncbi:MAG: homoprotocatechuate degradation operon regulator HpaR [Caulobacteraceae bacterium]